MMLRDEEIEFWFQLGRLSALASSLKYTLTDKVTEENLDRLRKLAEEIYEKAKVSPPPQNVREILKDKKKDEPTK